MPVVAQVPEVTGAEPSFVVSGSRGAHRVAVVFPEQAGGAHQDLTLRRESELDALGDRPDGIGPDVHVTPQRHQEAGFRLSVEFDRKSVVSGKSVSVRVDLGGASILTKINQD